MAITVRRATICLTANMLKQMKELCEYYEDNNSRILRRALSELYKNTKLPKNKITTDEV